MSTLYICLVIPAIFAAVHYFDDRFIWNTIATATCAVISIILCEPAPVMAYFLSVAGDYFMSHQGRSPRFFLYGICGFFAAHVCFLIYALSAATLSPSPQRLIAGSAVIIILLISYTLFLFKKIHPAIHDGLPMKLATSLYTYISCAVLGASLFNNSSALSAILFAAGIGSIVFSDTIIALSAFMGIHKYNKLICPTYTLCHILTCAALIASNT